MRKFVDDHQGIEKDLKEVVIYTISNVPEYAKENKEIIRHNQQDLLDGINFAGLQDDFDKRGVMETTFKEPS